MWGNDVLHRADSYSYIDNLFNYDGNFNKAKCDLFARSNVALFPLITKCRQLNLAIDVQHEVSSSWLYRLSCTGVKSGDTKGPVF